MRLQLVVETKKVEEINSQQLQDMWQLYKDSYDFVNEDEFYRDFYLKSHVFVGRDSESKQIRGFSTVYLYPTVFEGRSYGVLYSGDTIISPEYWGQKALHIAFLKFILKWKIMNPFKTVYWNLIASGNRTYLAMARYVPNYFARYDQRTPASIKRLMDNVGQTFFGEDYQEGIIHVDAPKAVLKPHLAPFNKQVLSLPEIDFFTKANPGYQKGNELMCFGEMSYYTYFYVLQKCLKKQMSKIIKNLLRNMKGLSPIRGR